MRKILLVILTFVFSITLGIFIFFTYKSNTLSKENNKLKEKIDNITSNNTTSKEENTNNKDRIDSIKKDKENILKEEEIWKETKEKLVKALS